MPVKSIVALLSAVFIKMSQNVKNIENGYIKSNHELKNFTFKKIFFLIKNNTCFRFLHMLEYKKYFRMYELIHMYLPVMCS